MFVLCLIPAAEYFLTSLLLHGSLSLWDIGFLLAGAAAFYFFRKRIYLFLFLTFCLGVLFFQILLIPGSVYQAWYLLLSDGRPEGTVSGLFAFTAGILSFPGYLELIRKHWYKGVLFLFLSMDLLAALLFPGWIPLIGMMVLLGALFLTGIPKKEKNSWNLRGIPILILSALLFSRIPADTETLRGSPLVDKLANRLRAGVLHYFPYYPLVFNLPGYGYSYQDSWGGGRPVLTPAALFEVMGGPGEVLYLKTESYSRFSGLVWIKDPPDVPEETSAEAASASYESRELLVLAEYFQRLPYTEKTEILSLNDEEFYYVGQDRRALELESGFPLGKGSRVILYETEGAGPNLEPDPLFLELPDFAIQEFGALAKQFSREDPVETAILLRNYLITQFTYSLDTDSSSSPVSEFLFHNPKGYCVHFASAFAVLARLNGIPTRLAGGFRVKIPEPDESMRPVSYSAVISGYSAHRWPEIFLPGEGWVIVEVTPPFTGENVSILDTEDRQTRRLLENWGEVDPVLPASPDPQKIWDISFPAVLGGILLLLACAAALLFRYNRKSSRLNRYVKRAVRYYKKMGILSPEENGWAVWVDSVADISRCIEENRSVLKESLFLYAYGPEKGLSMDVIGRILKEDRRFRNRGF